MTPLAPPLTVLWDIDGTLMRTPGVGVRAFVTAVEEVTGRTWERRRLDFGGRTDPEIAGLLLAAVGVNDASLVTPVLAAVARAYADLDAELHAAVRLMPGVVGAVGTLEASGALQTVVTGNLEVVARRKLSAGGLVERLRVELGAFGSDHVDRAALVELALARIAGAQIAVDRDAVWVVGDTPRDLACARAAGVHCLLVATGTYSFDDLSRAGADAVLADLGEIVPFIEALGISTSAH